MAQRSDIVVIGGGIIGLAIARRLCQSGSAVTVLEQHRTGRGASWAAAGMLAPHCEFDEPDPYFILCRAGLERYAGFVESLREETGRPIDYNATGMIYPALSGGEQARLETRYERHRRNGVSVERLTVREARRREPDLSNRIRMALRYPDDHQVENRDVVAALAQSVRLLGGVIREGVTARKIVLDGNRVAGVDTTDGLWNTPTVVNAMGCRARYLEGIAAAHRIPIRPVRGQILALRTSAATPFKHTIYTAGAYLVPRSDGRLIVGATVEEAGFRDEVTLGGVMQLFRSALELAPGLKSWPLDSTWSGLRPVARDGWPVLGAMGTPGLYAASGHGRNGILLAPLTGDLIAEAILHDRVPPIMRPFLPDRFYAARTGETNNEHDR
ncbi:MAG: glycine oxidase ThiO [Gemmatimonadetes bacterium]|nr:glycine oxidase ThiO [Gemmatimonadota bacterium]